MNFKVKQSFLTISDIKCICPGGQITPGQLSSWAKGPLGNFLPGQRAPRATFSLGKGPPGQRALGQTGGGASSPGLGSEHRCSLSVPHTLIALLNHFCLFDKVIELWERSPVKTCVYLYLSFYTQLSSNYRVRII